MRDVKRIDKIINLLRIIWYAHPDWRFCQLYTNLFGNGDNFYLEDDKVEIIFESIVSNLKEV